MTTPQITSTGNGWIVSQGANKTQITDTNRNGIFDNGDDCKVLNGDKFTTEQMQSVSNSLTQPQQQQTYQPVPTQQKKSGNIFSKIFSGIGNFFTGFAGGLMSMFGFGGGIAGDAWSRNANGGVGFNDMQVGLYANRPGMLQMDTMGIAGSMGFNPMAMSMGGGMMDFNIGGIMSMMDQTMKTNDAMYQVCVEANEKERTEATYKEIEKFYDNFKKNPETINESNLNKYEGFMNNAKENQNKFSDKEKSTLSKIISSPLIKEELIQDANNEENKLTPQTAVQLNTILAKYNAETDPEKKEKILKKEDYDTLTSILSKDALEAEDIKTVGSIIK